MTITYTSERDVKKQVKKLLDRHKYFWWMPPANGYGAAGISDIKALKAGVFIAIETKFKSNTLTANQRGFLNSIQSEDGFAFVVDEKNIGQLERWLSLFEQASQLSAQQKILDHSDGADLIDCLHALTVKI